jgi:RNA polymerase sigma-70 factor (ECF subfamily)
MRAARFEVGRRRRIGADGGAKELDDLAVQAADDALVGVLRKLHTYRGDSRFTTWAYKFAVLEAAVKLRRRPWYGRELPLHEEAWARLPDEWRASPAGQAEASELIGAVRDAIAEVLTPQQRAVLVAITLNDVPIDVLAERRGTTRGALYKTLHDARRKLRARLAKDGLTPDGSQNEDDVSAVAHNKTEGDPDFILTESNGTTATQRTTSGGRRSGRSRWGYECEARARPPMSQSSTAPN